MSQGNRIINQKLFENVPSEIIIDILSRLPVRSVISCKCVQKSWLHLVETSKFINYHLSKSTPGLIICPRPLNESNLYMFYDIQDGFDVEHHDLHYRLVTKSTLPNVVEIMGSADGLLLLCNMSKRDVLYLCNPITRDYIKLDRPDYYDQYLYAVGYGFGLSKMTKQYKLIWIFTKTHGLHKSSETECYVYTLGTESWRRQASCDLLQYGRPMAGTLANGHLHWLTCYLGIASFLRIVCFDLETEQFSTFYPPTLPWEENCIYCSSISLFVLGGCLGICDNRSRYEVVIWVMKEYGIEKSWTKELVLSNDLQLLGSIYPIKVFKNGDVLIKYENELQLFYYSSKYKTTREVDVFNLPWTYANYNAFLHTSSFLSLKSFGLDVSSF